MSSASFDRRRAFVGDVNAETVNMDALPGAAPRTFGTLRILDIPGCPVPRGPRRTINARPAGSGRDCAPTDDGATEDAGVSTGVTGVLGDPNSGGRGEDTSIWAVASLASPALPVPWPFTTTTLSAGAAFSVRLRTAPELDRIGWWLGSSGCELDPTASMACTLGEETDGHKLGNGSASSKSGGKAVEPTRAAGVESSSAEVRLSSNSPSATTGSGSSLSAS
mmetsp:Transcript_30395/g.70901  ORF Transcript_30395/g.70901 Transcript_30395/m.70901 type:complete len:222 (+) Transcript_30395:93-758(+)